MVSQAGKEHVAEAVEMLAQANATARAAGMNDELARGLLSVSWVHQQINEREMAITAWLEALDQIEKLRDLQSDDIVRARFFSQWAFTYYRLISYLLWTESGGPSSEDIELALRVAERLRARTLLDTLDASPALVDQPPATPTEKQRGEVLARIVRVQRQLLAPAVNEEDRRLASADLSRLEAEEYRLREALARENPSFQRLRDPRIPDIAAIQAALDPDQAVLSYQITLEAFFNSWVILVTRDQAMAFPVPARQRLEESVAAMLGLLERRDGSEATGLRRLSADLLDAPLAKAGPGIRRLIVVPDGPLAQLPFERLVESPLEITRVPSVTAWSRWRERRQVAARGDELLALADPDLPDQGAPSADAARAATLASGLRLERLPGSRLEAKALLRAFGGAGTVLAGSGASEHALKTSDLSRIRVLDFATHAVMDQEHPERNAVLLAAGSDEEDGLLQPREVANLDLEGSEGMLSLSRSFFQAGAVAVVGSLWPLRDEETSRMMKSFAGHLGKGLSVGAAMAAARADIKATGAPTQAWAGLVVLGDGDFVPLPGGRKRSSPVIGWAMAGLAAAVLAWLLARRLPALRKHPA
jgi:CHAT domain-containing protein